MVIINWNSSKTHINLESPFDCANKREKKNTYIYIYI